MNVKISDIMVPRVITAQPHHSVDHVRSLMEKNRVSAVPVVDSDDHPVGMVTSTDLVAELKGGSPISSIMGDKVYTVPQYDDVHIAARIMRNHKLHHVVVTHEKRVVGILSSFDLLQLVEEHRFTMKNPPQQAKRKGSRRD